MHDGCLMSNEGISDYKLMKNKVVVVKLDLTKGIRQN